MASRLVFAVLACFVARPALAAGFDEWTIGLSAGARLRSEALDSGGRQRWLGPLLGGEILAGFSDAWSAHATLDVDTSLGPDLKGACRESRTSGTVALSGSAGVVYALDVVRAIPFAELALAAVDGRPAQGFLDLGIQIGVGVDVAANRRFRYGLLARAALVPVGLGHSDGFALPARWAVVMAARVTYRLF